MQKPLHHRIGHICRNVSLVAMVCALVVIGWMAYRLSAAPIPIDWATPFLEQALQSAGSSTGNLNLNNLFLIWNGADHRIEFSAEQVRLADAEKTLTAVERVNVTLSITALFRGQLRVKDITLVGPQLHLSLPHIEQNPVGAAPLAFLSDKDTPLARLHSLSIQHGMIDLEHNGQHDSLSNVELNWERNGKKSHGIFNAALRLADAPAPSLIHAALHETENGTDITASANDIRPESIQTILADTAPNLLPANLSPNRLQMPVSFDGAVHLDNNERLQSIDGQIVGGSGHILLPELYDTAVPIRDLHINGTYQADSGDWEIQNFRLAILDEDGPMTLQLQAAQNTQVITVNTALPDANMTAVKRWWPAGVAPGVISWLNDNVSAGKISHMGIHATLKNGRDGYNVTAAHGDFDLNDVTSKFMPTFPPVTGINGKAVLTDPDNIHFDIKSGHVGDIAVQSSTMDISGLNADMQILKMDMKETGQLPDMLKLLDTPPYGYAKKYGLKAGEDHGSVGLDLQFEFPLLAALKISDVKYHALANVNQLILPAALMGKDISNGKGIMELDPTQMKIVGSADVAGAPMQFTWQDYFAPQDGLTRSVKFNSELQAKDHVKLGLPTAGYVAGLAQLTGTYEERRDKKSLQAKMDLATATVKIDELNFTKPSGVALLVNTSLDMGNLNNFGVTAVGQNIALDGTGVLDGNMNPRKLNFGVLRLGDKTNAKLEITQDGGRERWVISGQSLDISHLFAPAPDAQATPAKPTQSTTANKPPRWIGMKLNSLFMANQIELKNVQAELNHDGRHWNKVLMQGNLANRTPLNIAWVLTGNKQTLNVITNDAGKTLSAFGVTDTLRGGHLSITGSGSPTAPTWLANGNINITDFKIVGAPFLAKLLAITSPGGLLDTLHGEGVGFTSLTSQFKYSDDMLRFQNGKMNGQSIGLTFAGDVRYADTPGTLNVTGTLVPLYMINTALSGVPILGDILGGSSGLLAFNYQVTGKLADPDVSVNPLSALTPGFLRGLLFDNSTPEKTP